MPLFCVFEMYFLRKLCRVFIYDKIFCSVCLVLCTFCFAGNEAENGRYELFSTTNRWTFLKLDTRTGKIWQVHFSVKGDAYRFQTALSLKNLAGDGKAVNGRFALYSTDNIYNFLLLGKSNGKVYQVQWGDRENRGVIEIE